MGSVRRHRAGVGRPGLGEWRLEEVLLAVRALGGVSRDLEVITVLVREVVGAGIGLAVLADPAR